MIVGATLGAGRVLAWAAGSCLAVTLLLAGGAGLVGLSGYTVLTGSMRPTLRPGDLVVERRVHPGAVRAGEVITFRDPARSGALVTHRVRSVKVGPRTTSFVTRGDANTSYERWTMRTDGTLGRAAFQLRGIGHLLVWGRKPMGRIALLTLPALLFGVLEVRRIWRRPEPQGVEVAA